MEAELILNNGRVFTVDEARPWAQAVACAGGRIVGVGSSQEMAKLAGPGVRVVELGGRLVLPGLTDAHLHFLHYALRQQEVSLFGVKSLEEVRERVRLAAESARPGSWVLGWGWDEIHWETAPHRSILDDVAPQTPVALKRMDMHSWWVNGAALQQAGITRQTVDPPESRIERDPDGSPNGILREWNAIDLVERQIPEPDENMLQAWLLGAIAEAHRLGLTGIHDQRVEGEGAVSFRLFQELMRQEKLALRVQLNIAADFLPEAARLGLQAGFGNDRLWVGQVKTFADGSMGSRTALMLEPFENESENYGLAVKSADEIRQLALQARSAGFHLAVHAIGDRAVREALDALGEPTGGGQEHTACLAPDRIEHAQLIDPQDMSRLAQQGVAASMQPVHLMADWPTAERVWGKRCANVYAFRSLLDRGTLLAFGSDAPVAPLNPMLGLHAAVNRQDWGGEPEGGWYPEERLSVAEAVHGYTMGPAVLAGRQQVQGSITPGKWADLVVLSQDIFDIPAAEIKDVDVCLTVFDGQIVHMSGTQGESWP